MKGRGTSRPRSFSGRMVLIRKATGQAATRGQWAHSEASRFVQKWSRRDVEEGALDGRPLVLVQFHRRPHLRDEPETVGG